MTRVTLLTTPDCPLCDHARQTLERVGKDFELTVEVVPADTDAGRALAAAAGFAFTPGVLLDGEAFSYGRLSERKLRRALQRHVSP